MARLPRLDLAGIAQHVVQRGNDRMACFLGNPEGRSQSLGLIASAPIFPLFNVRSVARCRNLPRLGVTRTRTAVARAVQLRGRDRQRLSTTNPIKITN